MTKTFIASIRDGETKELTIMEHDGYKTKKAFRDDLRGNGYQVRFISTPETFDEDVHKYHEKLERNRIHAQIRRDVRREMATSNAS